MGAGQATRSGVDVQQQRHLQQQSGGAPRRRRLLDPHSSTFASFADVLYTGALVFVTMLPLVTAFAGFSAGVQVFREARFSDGHVTVGAFARVFWQRVTRFWLSHLAVPTVVLAVLVAELLVLPAVGVDATLALVIPAVLTAVAGAVGLRFAGTLRSDTMTGRQAFAESWRRMSDDPVGSLLLAGAVLTATVIVSFATMLIIVIAGPLVLAAVAIDRRYEVMLEDQLDEED